jgi:heterotetrameric sarcosine oxidase delta subunit
MILIPCPYCGPRNSNEFTYFGELEARPAVGEVSEAQWRDYLYAKKNPAGLTTEKWQHSAGCGKFFVAERHTLTNKVRRTYLPGAREADPGKDTR